MVANEQLGEALQHVAHDPQGHPMVFSKTVDLGPRHHLHREGGEALSSSATLPAASVGGTMAGEGEECAGLEKNVGEDERCVREPL
jgi:hypothetical protein